MQYWPYSLNLQKTSERMSRSIKKTEKDLLDYNTRKIYRHVEHALENTDIEPRILIMERLIKKYNDILHPRSKL